MWEEYHVAEAGSVTKDLFCSETSRGLCSHVVPPWSDKQAAPEGGGLRPEHTRRPTSGDLQCGHISSPDSAVRETRPSPFPELPLLQEVEAATQLLFPMQTPRPSDADSGNSLLLKATERSE